MKFDKLVVFLRSNNDIDNIAPVVYKWAEELSEPVTVVLRSPVLASDFRVEFLSQYETVNVLALEELLSISTAMPSSISYTVTKTVRELQRTIGLALDYRSDAAAILDVCVDADEDALLAFDYLPGRESPLYALYKALTREANERGHTTVALPHGGGNLENALIRSDKLATFISESKFEAPDVDLQALYYQPHDRMDIVDYIITPNELFRRRFERIVCPSKLKNACYARFTPEWIKVLKDIVPHRSTFGISQSTVVVLFLGRLCCHMNKEEIELTVNFASSLPSVHVAVKNHPREKIISDVSAFENPDDVEVVDDIKSPALLESGDVFLDTGSSVVYHAVVRGNPVLELDYLHANKSVFSTHLPSCAVDTYDQLYHTLSSLVEDGESEFYDEDDRQQFIDQYVGGADRDGLYDYIELFDSL